jgi:poly [ADP-ribose] polymerase 2/3/4
MSSARAWRLDENGAPPFPDDFEVRKMAVLQLTDIKSNHNKYYAIELHTGTLKGKAVCRVFTHYGRTDDLEFNSDAGRKECRFFASAAEAESLFDSIYREKTSPRKGYKELSLASARIGSSKGRGASCGEVDAKTIRKIAEAKGVPAPETSDLHPKVQELVRYLYAESTNALTSTVAVRITARGIETPLGILTLGQIEKGEAILLALYELFQRNKPRKYRTKIVELSGEFFTTIPHRIGRTRAAVSDAVIDSLGQFHQKQETLQLMKDMLQVNGEDGLLFESRIDAQYRALGCRVDWVDRGCARFDELTEYVVKSQVKSRSVKVLNVYSVKRDDEWGSFTESLSNQRVLFHGSRVQNWVGILSRGIVLPKIAVSMGVHRTDAGWLGNGIYFGDAACTSAAYTSPGKGGSRFMALTRVALGNAKQFRKITYGLTSPPDGYDSCHGVRGGWFKPSQFADDEYVVYRTNQQRLEYLVEFKS